MAEEEHEPLKLQKDEEELKKVLCSYIGLSFTVFLALLPKTQLRELSLKLFRAEEELRQMKSRRQEDSKANARVVEIFASHRNAWQAEEKRLLQQIDAAAEEIARLRGKVEESRARVEELEREVAERDDMISFMSRRIEEDGLGACQSRECYGVPGKKSGEWLFQEEEEVVGTTRNVEVIYEHHHQQQTHQLGNEFDSEFMASASKFWAEKASLWQVCARNLEN